MVCVKCLKLKYKIDFPFPISGECGSHLDRHANIGKGKIGLKAFKRLVNDPRFKNIPMVLETPVTDKDPLVYKKEIKLLYKQID